MFSIACFTLTARIITRLSTRCRLYLDDFFIILGFIILSGTTYLMHSTRNLFVSEAIVTDLIRYVTIKELLGLSNSISVLQAFFCMAWSTIFCVKFSLSFSLCSRFSLDGFQEVLLSTTGLSWWQQFWLGCFSLSISLYSVLLLVSTSASSSIPTITLSYLADMFISVLRTETTPDT